MQAITVKYKKVLSNARIPTYGSKDAAGADLYACLDKNIVIGPGESILIHTGIAMEIPKGFVGLIFARSGLATKKGIAPSNKVGVIDADYRGEIMVSLFNQSGIPFELTDGERIAQISIIPYYSAVFEESELSGSERGAGGFGSTGK